MKTIVAVAGAVMVLMGVGLAIAHEEETAGKAAQAVKKQTVCPVMGGPINTNVYADTEGKRVYFCCNGCPAEFKKNPAKYITKLEKSGVTLEKTPAADRPKQAAGAAKSAACDATCTNGGGCCE